MDIDLILALITVGIAALCWLFMLIAWICDRVSRSKRVIAEQTSAIERVYERETKIQRNRNRTFFETYCYGVGIDTTKLIKKRG